MSLVHRLSLSCLLYTSEEDQIKPEASFVEDLGADSLDIVELIMGIEEEFDIEIPDEDAEKLTTVGEAMEYVKTKLAVED